MEIRAATLDDVERLAAFMGRCTLAHQGVRRDSAAEIRQRLTRPGTDPELDSWLAEDGDVIGLAQAWVELETVVCYVRVDPAHRGRGVATELFAHARRRAVELGATRLHATSWPQDEAAAPFLEAQGFEPIRYFSLMTIDLDGPPRAETPARPLSHDEDPRRLFEAVQAVFPEQQSFETWLHEYEGFDPTLWFVVEDEAGIAGFALCLPELAEDPESGYVAELGVREDRRGEGLGLALLRQTFVEFHRRGKRRVSLHVDVNNLTGALRLYEKAGMTADPRVVLWERSA
jgi:mycothiol synthase